MDMKLRSLKVSESRQERSDRVAREVLHAEQQALQRKTARLRALRMEKESSTG